MMIMMIAVAAVGIVVPIIHYFDLITPSVWLLSVNTDHPQLSSGTIKPLTSYQLNGSVKYVLFNYQQ